MIEELLPASVAAVETFGHDDTAEAALYPEEAALVERAVTKRRREFATVRVCARAAMERLGVPPHPVLTGERGAPNWPGGLVGSMTHCEGYAAAALARAGDLASLGVDAEPHGPLPDGVLEAVALPAERARLARLTAHRPDLHWDRLLFSAKESVYKAWFPLTGAWLDFSEADIDLTPAPDTETSDAVAADRAAPDAGAPGTAASGAVVSGTLRAELLVPGPLVAGHRLGHFEGRWTIQRGLAVTVVVVPVG
ncbi:4'-phosphopantetheinyl transferase superfamily protein [Streptomyces sp. NPDC093252]|uniref:4'-phosphopantetheinyl transferase family protein n=1 Tax=Streptomyces sp. NPDC093252 TaxID=3154980 RepID=UPI003437258D